MLYFLISSAREFLSSIINGHFVLADIGAYSLHKLSRSWNLTITEEFQVDDTHDLHDNKVDGDDEPAQSLLV